MAALVVLAAPVRGGDTQTEVWPEAQAFFKFKERLRLHLLADVWYALRSWTPDGTESASEAETGVHLDVTIKPIARPRLRTRHWERERYFWARVGYDYLWTPGDPAQPSHEDRGILEATARAPLPGRLWLVNRARLDVRDKNGTRSERYRARLLLERETPLLGIETVPLRQRGSPLRHTLRQLERAALPAGSRDRPGRALAPRALLPSQGRPALRATTYECVRADRPVPPLKPGRPALR